ncbi:MAG: hypothetical protein SF053_17060 [Bacteroidia bacterium]|nr:hypothetical protein [Bacteroidia bacterium]
MTHALSKNLWFVRIFHWEFWPSQLANIPIICYWLYFAARARSLTYFSAVNPAIETGGMYGESKIRILDQIPAAYKPLTLYSEAGTPLEILLPRIEAAGITFPLIAKPDIGERGLRVEKIHTPAELATYLAQTPVALLIQEYIDYPEEYSVFHYRFPGQPKGVVSSLCHKIHLSVTGDGVSTLRDLIRDYPRAHLQLPVLEQRLAARMNDVPPAGEKVLLLPIGNHARGAMFLDLNHEIDENLLQVFDDLSHRLPGIYFCRHDLKCRSLADLKAGQHFKILEINGVAGEPAHIYDPDYSMAAAYKDSYHHWKIMYQISRAQHAAGVPYMSWKEAWTRLQAYFQYKKQFS